jgi:acyl-CoA synthetase (AMP-forming)/AMP-acid ligase II
VVRGPAPGWTAFEDAIRAQPLPVPDVDPDDPALVFMTSGTTSGAKAVVHSTRTYLSYPLRTCRWVGVGWADRTLSAFTLGHIGGLTWAVAVPLFTGGSAIITDRWDAEFAVSAIQHQGVTYAGGTALFAREMLDVLAQTGTAQLPLARGFTCGASPFTTALSEAVERAGLGANRAYGMSECPTVSGSAKFDTLEVRLGSDGRIAPGCEIRVVGDDGGDMPPGEVGEFVVRGPHRALGYLDAQQTRESFDAEGWFRTGDLGTLSSDGVVTVTGRLKDIIKRGGEKFSSREVEDLLSLHPAVFESAVVPAPHERYGEQPAAFVLLRQGQSAEPPELSAFLRTKGLATQKIPQVWRYVSELPRTPAGKVKKYELQAALATGTDQPA